MKYNDSRGGKKNIEAKKGSELKHNFVDVAQINTGKLYGVSHYQFAHKLKFRRDVNECLQIENKTKIQTTKTKRE